jgi:hypothetical protein
MEVEHSQRTHIMSQPMLYRHQTALTDPQSISFLQSGLERLRPHQCERQPCVSQFRQSACKESEQ